MAEGWMPMSRQYYHEGSNRMRLPQRRVVGLGTCAEDPPLLVQIMLKSHIKHCVKILLPFSGSYLILESPHPAG